MNYENENEHNCTICKSDFKAPLLWKLRTPEFCAELARFYDELDLSGPATLCWLLAQLFEHHSGKLFDQEGKLLAIQTDPRLTDNAWGEDERRTVFRFRERALRSFKNLLQKRMIPAVTLLHFGREIYLCRTSGKCGNE